MDPADGTVLSTLILSSNLDPVSLAYTSSDGGHLYVLDGNPNEVVAIDAGTGERIDEGSFGVPIDISTGGMAVDPVTGNLWVGSNQSSFVVEMSLDGTEVRRVDLAPQSVANNEIAGLAFDNAGNLLVSSLRGVVYVLNVLA